MRNRAFAAFAVFAALAAACSPPKFTRYKSVSGDWSAFVPWGWNVVAEAEYDGFAETKFLGPFDADFYLATPSLSVRWYKRYRPHSLRGGTLEMYADADDFISQTIQQIYGPDAVLKTGGRLAGKEEFLDRTQPIPEVVLRESGLTAKVFSVVSPAPAPAGTVGAVKTVDGAWQNMRDHEYAVVPMEGGFYVLCYPATLLAHDKGLDRFNALAATFHPYTAGPGGPKVLLPGPQAAASN